MLYCMSPEGTAECAACLTRAYGHEFQPSLLDLVYSHFAPNAEALGYCRPVPPGLLA